MRRNRTIIMMLVIVTVLAIATTALAGKPDRPGKPDKPTSPDIWTCAERVENGASWVLGDWVPGHWEDDVWVEGHYAASGVPVCIDLDFAVAHKHVTKWTVTWEGTALRKDPRGLMLIFEEELPGTHYAEIELPQPDMPTNKGTWEAVLDLDADGDDIPDNEHLVFVAMPRLGDKWDTISFTVTPKGP